ncbi:hypothetical protein [Streptomyces sp. LN704]|uniref:hypothetical protein n=1 Tax=Streptomyces sp. LN704 TaxID=3112982 RepID=UPI003713EFD8
MDTIQAALAGLPQRRGPFLDTRLLAPLQLPHVRDHAREVGPPERLLVGAREDDDGTSAPGSADAAAARLAAGTGAGSGSVTFVIGIPARDASIVDVAASSVSGSRCPYRSEVVLIDSCPGRRCTYVSE